MIQGKESKKKKVDYAEKAESRKHSRHPHPDLLLTDKECMSKYGYIPFPGRQRKEWESVEDCRYRWYVYLQDIYPASGSGNKPFEDFTEHGLAKAKAEYFEELNNTLKQWLAENPNAEKVADRHFRLSKIELN